VTSAGRRWSPFGRLLRHPAAAVVTGFAVAVAFGTVLLMLPMSAEGGTAAPPMIALFTTVSSVCVTGLIVVDTPTYWSTFGELVILVMIQLGGLGIMTVATLLLLVVAKRIGLHLQLSAMAETRAVGLGEVRRVVWGVLAVSGVVELVTALFLTVRFGWGYDEPLGTSMYWGVFHAVSAFNNAGFALFTDNMMSFATDPWICMPLGIATILGGLGFPVLFEIGRRLRGRSSRWSLHVRVTVITYAILFVIGVGAFLLGEWNNPRTIGSIDTGGKIVIGVFHGIQPRTAGFNSIDMGQADPSTLLITDVLMFIGGGSAGTAGGIKVTTFALLAFVMLAEIRGEPSVHVLGRRLPAAIQRQALTVALAAVGLVMAATVTLLEISPIGLDAVLFETVSAFATVGLSTGITDDLPVAGQLVLVALMFVGRLGPITLASALALREHERRYELPEERTIVG
jgi:trk system potassium uptake protein TrkH